MNIGLLSQALPYLPSRGGFRLYGGNLIRALSSRHRIDLVSLLIEDDAQHLDWASAYCASVQTVSANGATLSGKMANAVSAHLWGRPLRHRVEVNALLRAGLLERKWDILHVEGPFAGGLVAEDLPVAKVLSLHDSWTLRCAEMRKCAQSLREKAYYTLLGYHEPRYERLVYPRFESCVVVSEQDAAAVRETVPDCDVEVVPYAVDTDHFLPVPVPERDIAVAFHGHLGYAPNIEAVLELADTILPLIRREEPRASLRLIAADPVARIRALGNRTDVTLTVNPPDVRPPVCAARVYACPIRHGTGMKTKVLEALAMQLPVVCYRGSISGIKCIPGKHLLVADNPQEFAAHVLALFREPDRADAIAAAGRELAMVEYSWESRGRDFEGLYAAAITQRRHRSGPRYSPRRDDIR